MNNNSLEKNVENERIFKLLIEFEKLEIEKGKLISYIIFLSLDYVIDRKDIQAEEKPIIASSGPFRIHLEKNKNYFYCTCGNSNMQVKYN